MIESRGRKSPYLFLAPAIVYLGIWIYYPIAKNFYLSFLGTEGTHGTDFRFVGVQNYRQLLSDELFHRALLHNLVWVLLSILSCSMISAHRHPLRDAIAANALIF